MKILITAPSLNPNTNVSGISSVVQNIIQHNTRNKYFHYLLGKPDQAVRKIRRIFQLIFQLLYFPFVLNFEKVNLVHQNIPMDNKGVLRESIINLWCYIFRVPVLLHIHGGSILTNGTGNYLINFLIIKMLNNSKEVIVLSEFEKKLLKDRYCFVKASVLPNCIDSSLYKSTSTVKNEIPQIIYIGRIEKNKGIAELVEALKLLSADFDFFFTLCGAGSMVGYCIENLKSLPENSFEYKGVVFGNNKIEIIKNSTIFILPSYFEGLPMSLIETMAAGVIPVVTGVGSMNSIVQHKVNGLIVKKKSSKDLYENLNFLLSQKELQSTLSINARNSVIMDYDIDNYIIKLNIIYSKILIKKQ